MGSRPCPSKRHWTPTRNVAPANPFRYRGRGEYVVDLRRYASRFGRDRLHVMVFEDTMGSAVALAGLFGFLGVDAGYLPAVLDTVVNAAAGEPTSISAELRHRLAEHFAPFNRALADEFGLDLSSWQPNP
jgi:hypothetical protein